MKWIDFLKKRKELSPDIKADLIKMEIPEEFWKELNAILQNLDGDNQRWEMLCQAAKLWANSLTDEEETAYEISIQALTKVTGLSDGRLREYISNYLNKLNDGENLGFWIYDYHKKQFRAIPYYKWIEGRYPDSLFLEKVRTILDEKESVNEEAYRWREIELNQDGMGMWKCHILVYREGISSFQNSTGNSRYYVMPWSEKLPPDEELIHMKNSKKNAESSLTPAAAMKKTSFFTACGALENQLESDLQKMKIPEEFLKTPYLLPMRYGYNETTGRYFASEPVERSNNWYLMFEDEDPEEFRWYILKYLAVQWSLRYEKTHRNELEKHWQKVQDKYVNNEWTYHENKNARYHAVYDHRKEYWQEAIRTLAKVYDLRGERMQKYIENTRKNLQMMGCNSSPIHWHFDEDAMEFTGIRFTEEEDFVKHIVKLFDITAGERPYEVMESVWMDRRNGMVYHLISKVHFGAGVWAEEDYGDPIHYRRVQELAKREGSEAAMKCANINFRNWEALI